MNHIPSPDPFQRSGTARWGIALPCVLAAHAALALYLFQQPPVTLAATAPEAMIVELAPAAVARPVEYDLQPAPAEQMSEASARRSPPKQTPPIKPDTASPKPPAERQPVLARSPRGQRPGVADTHGQTEQSPRPQPRNEPRHASNAAAPPKVAAPEAQQTAARQSSRGAPDPAVQAQWQALLLAHLERYKHYPPASRARGDRGMAYLRFEIDAQGHVLSAQIARSSGFAELDRATLDMARRASPVPAPPPGSPSRFTVPVVFTR